MQDLLAWIRERMSGTPGRDAGDERIVTDLEETSLGPGYTTIYEGDEGIEP